MNPSVITYGCLINLYAKVKLVFYPPLLFIIFLFSLFDHVGKSLEGNEA